MWGYMLRLRRTGYDKPVGYIKTGIDGRRLRRSVVARYVRVPRLQLEGCDVHGQSLTVMSYSLSA